MPETLPNWILTYALHSTFLGLVALGFAHRIRRADHRALALRMALFGALLSSTLPFQWTPAVTGPGAQLAALSQGGATSPEAALDASFLAPALGTAGQAALHPVKQARAEAPADAAPWPGAAGFARAHWLFLAIFLLLAVAAVRLLRLERARRRFVKGLARTTLHDPSSRAKLDAWAATEGRAPVRLCQSPHATSPLALSGTEICVPAEDWDRLSRDEREAVLAHEFAHLLRRDPLWFTLAAVMERAFWFLPLHGWLRRRAAIAAEVACDASAARRVGSALVVARSLAAIATRERVGAPIPALIPAMATTKGELVTRVESLLRDPDLADGDAHSLARGKRFYACAALSALAFACGAPNVDNGEPQPDPVAAEIASGPGMLVVDLDTDGSATLRSEGTEAAEISLRTREGREALRAWLEEATVDAPRGGPESTTGGQTVHLMPTSMPLLLRAHPGMPFKFVQFAMSQCASPKVQLWDIRLQSSASLGSTVPIPLPFDVGVSTDLALALEYRVDVRIDAATNGSGCRYTVSLEAHAGGPFGALFEEVEEGLEQEEELGGDSASEPATTRLPGPKACSTLAELREQLRSLGDRFELTVGMVDPRKGTTMDDVQPILDLLLEADVQSIRFMGSYEG